MNRTTYPVLPTADKCQTLWCLLLNVPFPFSLQGTKMLTSMIFPLYHSLIEFLFWSYCYQVFGIYLSCLFLYHWYLLLMSTVDCVFCLFIFIYIFILKNFLERFIWERELCVQAGGGRGKRTPCWVRTLRSWPEPQYRVRCLTNWATKVPQGFF